MLMWLILIARTIWVLVQYSRSQYPTVAYVVLFLCSPGQAGRLQTTWPGIFFGKKSCRQNEPTHLVMSNRPSTWPVWSP